MHRPIVIWGAAGHAKVLLEFLPRLGFEPMALFDNDPDICPPDPAIPLYRGEAGLIQWRASFSGAVSGLVAIGGARGRDRLELQVLFARHGVDPVAVVHPSACIASTAGIGAGTQVLAQAVVGADTRIGRGCIVNTAAVVDHECVLADGVHIAPRAALAGCVEVGAASFVGIGAVVLPRIRIGANAIVGAGAVVTHDVPDNVIVYGNPARFIRNNAA